MNELESDDWGNNICNAPIVMVFRIESYKSRLSLLLCDFLCFVNYNLINHVTNNKVMYCKMYQTKGPVCLRESKEKDF